jgi:hypothetical protein
MFVLRKSEQIALGFDLDQAIAGFMQALADHQYTVDQPAPTAHPLVERIVFGFGGDYEIEDDTPPSPAVESLDAYVRRRTWEIRVGGTTINGAPVRTDPDSLVLINGMAALAQVDPARVFKFDAGTIVELSSAQAIGFAATVGNWIQSTFDKRAEILASIANGLISTKTEIEAELIGL